MNKMSCGAHVKLLCVVLLFFTYCHNNAVGLESQLPDIPSCPAQVELGNVCTLNAPCSQDTLNQTNGNCSLLINRLLSSHGSADASQSKLPNLYVWIYSLASAFFISIAGVWGYLFLPLMTGPYRHHVMNILIGLSFGSLITSALCQLIPEAYELGRITSNSNYLYVAGISMVGLWLTWFLQGFASIIGKDYAETEKTIKRNTSVELKNKNINSKNVIEKTNNGVSVYTFPIDNEHMKQAVPGEMTKTVDEFPATLKHRASFASYSSLKKKSPKLSKLAIVILVGDCLNNFMDGISIGAGYSYYLSTGIKLTTAIAFEEYTHKLGDFAIVFQSGVPMRRVLFWNYTTSCACFIGVAIGIALGNLQWSQYIFSFASGLFLIIALSNMIPEMQNMLDESLSTSRKAGLVTLFEQHLGFLFAFVLLIIISAMLNSHSAFLSGR